MLKMNTYQKMKGQGLVEYALILVLVAVVVIAVLLILGPNIGAVFSKVNSDLVDVGGGGGGNPPSNPPPASTPTTPPDTHLTFICPAMPDCTSNCVSGVVDVTRNGSYSTYLTCTVEDLVTVDAASYGSSGQNVAFHTGTFGGIPADGQGPVLASITLP
jgi:pilus assembly protein Flp/PilA